MWSNSPPTSLRSRPVMTLLAAGKQRSREPGSTSPAYEHSSNRPHRAAEATGRHRPGHPAHGSPGMTPDFRGFWIPFRSLYSIWGRWPTVCDRRGERGQKTTDHLTGYSRQELKERNSRGLRILKPKCTRPCRTCPPRGGLSWRCRASMKPRAHMLPETGPFLPLRRGICAVHSCVSSSLFHPVSTESARAARWQRGSSTKPELSRERAQGRAPHSTAPRTFKEITCSKQGELRAWATAMQRSPGQLGNEETELARGAG